MKRHVKIIFLVTLGLLLDDVSEAQALTCTNQSRPVDASSCKEADFVGGVLCVPEPFDREEIAGGGVCILGKFKQPKAVEGLADLVISYDFTGELGGLVPDLVVQTQDPFVPELERLASTGEFTANFSLPAEGTYLLAIQGRLVQGDGSYQDIFISRILHRVALPHLTVTKARACSSTTGCTVDNSNPLKVTDVAGTGQDPAHTIRLGSPAKKATNLDFCIGSHGGEVNAGRSVEVDAVNTITDSSTFPPREVTLTATCADKNTGICALSSESDPFCPGGFRVSVPVAHGKNQITLSLKNRLGSETIPVEMEVDLKGPELCIRYRNSSGDLIENVDGKNLLASETGGADSVTVDVTLGACGGKTEVIAAASPEYCNPDNPPPCAELPPANPPKTGGTSFKGFTMAFPKKSQTYFNASARLGWLPPPAKRPKGPAPVCLRMNNESEGGAPKLLALCPSEEGDGQTHYQARLDRLRYPINTVTVQADDDLGNRSLKTSAFGYGEVRPLFNAEGRLDLQGALIPEALGGFVPEKFVNGELKKVIYDAVNSEKFKNEFFPKLLDPHRPGGEEGACLKSIEDQVNCSYDHLASPDRVVALKMFCDNGRCDKIGTIDIPTLQFLNDNTLRVQLHVNGLRERAEIYTLKFGENDKDGFPEGEAELARRMELDPDFGVWTIPVKFAVKSLRINLDIRFFKDQGGRLRVQMSPANLPGRDMIEAVPDGDHLIVFDCGKKESELIRGFPIDTDACEGLESLNDNAIVNFLKGIHILGEKARKLQGTDKQFLCTMEALTLCSLPKQVEAKLDEFDLNRGDGAKVLAISQEIFDKRFNLDFFAPLAAADISIDPTGLGFSGSGLLLPAGVTDPADKGEKSSSVFLNSLPQAFKNEKFGPLSEADLGMPPDPIEAAFQMGSEINLALKEETINSLLHSVGLLLWDLDRFEEERRLDHRTLDLSAKRLKEEFGMQIADIGGNLCKDKKGKEDPTGFTENWKCFPFPLSVEIILGADTLKYVDFNDDGEAGDGRDKQAPILIRNKVSPFSPPAVRVVSVSPTEIWDKDGNPGRAEIQTAEIEIGLEDMTMSLFEERVKDWKANVIEGTGDIRSWCEHFPKVDPDRCQKGLPVPLATFKLSGRLFITLLLDNRDEGLIRAEGGISSIIGKQDVVMDTQKTYLEFTAVENNTIVPDNDLAAIVKDKITNVLFARYAFGLKRDVRLTIPAQVPLEGFCSRYPNELPDLCKCFNDDKTDDGDGCENAALLEDLWEKIGLDGFGINNLAVVKPLLGLTGVHQGPTRTLTIGTDADFNPPVVPSKRGNESRFQINWRN